MEVNSRYRSDFYPLGIEFHRLATTFMKAMVETYNVRRKLVLVGPRFRDAALCLVDGANTTAKKTMSVTIQGRYVIEEARELHCVLGCIVLMLMSCE